MKPKKSLPKKQRVRSYNHDEWCWADQRNNDSILVSELTEKEARDALCQAIELIEKVSSRLKDCSDLISEDVFI